VSYRFYSSKGDLLGLKGLKKTISLKGKEFKELNEFPARRCSMDTSLSNTMAAR